MTYPIHEYIISIVFSMITNSKTQLHAQRQILRLTRHPLESGDSRNIVRPNVTAHRNGKVLRFESSIGAEVFILHTISDPASVISINQRFVVRSNPFGGNSEILVGTI